MSVEPRRGCGYRKIGGLYLVSGVLASVCHRLPISLHVCPTCNQGIKFSRGWTWVNPVQLYGDCPDFPSEFPIQCICYKNDGRTCGICFPKDVIGEKAGLMWVGEKFYSTESFLSEGKLLGVSKRINTIPRGFKVGETFVLLAHNKVRVQVAEPEKLDSGLFKTSESITPAIFALFRPSHIEKIVAENSLTDEEREKLTKQGITIIEVPGDDPDHQPSKKQNSEVLV